MKRNQKVKYHITIITTVVLFTVILLFYFVCGTSAKSKPNVFLEFQYTSNDYYKILINDSVIIDSERIKSLKYSNEHYKTKVLNLKLDNGNYKIQIKDLKEIVLSESLLKIDNAKPKYIYFKKEVVITDKPFIRELSSYQQLLQRIYAINLIGI